MSSWGIHWFRRDLRIAGNQSLAWSRQTHQGRVLGIFTFDRKFLSRPDFSPDRFQFFLNTLAALRSELQAAGGDLLVLDVGPSEAFALLWKQIKLANKNLPTTISWSRDYEPFARARDEHMRRHFEDVEISVHTDRDHLLIEPHELLKDDGNPYKIYTPFSKRWFSLLHTKEIQGRIALQRAGLEHFKQAPRGTNTQLFFMSWKELLGEHTPTDHLQNTINQNQLLVSVPIPEAGSIAGWERAKSWARQLAFYGDTRDFMGTQGTSRLAAFLKNGSLTTAQIIAAYDLEYLNVSGTDGATIFLKELAWREFYYHILWHYPEVETQEFQVKYRGLDWDNDEDLFKRWKDGTTGFPIVDAAMRELATTGWMHNRARMIVASFLTKDLLIDWRWGERWFMQKLLDGDLAPNNGGWQWAASTGCDAQPYFRVFNPELQSKRFDPEGLYIRRYVPELKGIHQSEIHNPSATSRRRVGYPEAVVDHARQKMRAIRMFDSKAKSESIKF